MISGVAAVVPVLLAYFTLRLAQAFLPNRGKLYISRLAVNISVVFLQQAVPFFK